MAATIGTLLQRTKFQCVDKAIGNHAGYTIDYTIGGTAHAQNLAVAIANDIVGANASGNSVHLTIYTPTGNVERDVSYGNTEEYGGQIYRVQVTSDSTVYIEFVLGPPPVTVRLQTIVPPTTNAAFGQAQGAVTPL
jgi:hypothetical protein